LHTAVILGSGGLTLFALDLNAFLHCYFAPVCLLPVQAFVI